MEVYMRVNVIRVIETGPREEQESRWGWFERERHTARQKKTAKRVDGIGSQTSTYPQKSYPRWHAALGY
jgi:hypothetical protein